MSDKRFKVLFIYPGLFMQTNLPLGIASLTAELKSKGIEVKVFDTVLYQEPGEIDENVERAEIHHSTKNLSYSTVGIEKKRTGLMEDFTKLLNEYKPDLIGLSTVESAFGRGIRLTRHAKDILNNVKVVAGGVFPTLAPEIVIKEDSIDMLCQGEGEEALAQLCVSLREKKDYTNIPSLWVKRNSEVVKNRMMEPKSLDLMIQPDFSIFDKCMFFKPMQGNLFKTIPIELSRSCPYQCAYCSEPALRRLYKENGHNSYFRKKTVSKLFEEIDVILNRHSPEFFYFATETFLAMNEAEFDEFIDGYSKVKIPFWVQTRPETITHEKIARLKEVGLFWLSIGVEHGNEEYRRKYLRRQVSNEKIMESTKILDKCGQGASLNSIIGFPFETRELIYETIMLNRQLFKLNNRIRCNISIFTPFRGCELYDICVSKGLLEPVPYINNTNISGESLLKFNNLSPSDLKSLYRIFPLYVYLPDQYLERIKKAEEFTQEGNKEYQALNSLIKEYLS